MSVGNKKTMSTIVYYTLAAITLVFAGFFIYVLLVREVATRAKIIYFIWSGFVIGTIVLALTMALVLYFANTGKAGLATDFFNLFVSVSLISIFTTGFMISTWVVGEHLLERKTENRELENTKM